MTYDSKELLPWWFLRLRCSDFKRKTVLHCTFEDTLMNVIVFGKNFLLKTFKSSPSCTRLTFLPFSITKLLSWNCPRGTIVPSS